MDPDQQQTRGAATDITDQWRRAVDTALRNSDLPAVSFECLSNTIQQPSDPVGLLQEEQQRLRSSLLLKPVQRNRTPFLKAADGVVSLPAVTRPAAPEQQGRHVTSEQSTACQQPGQVPEMGGSTKKGIMCNQSSANK
jgi:hypothetical protein